MPIRPPSLDDRNFDDLVEELLARIPAHTPEWTNPRVGDPGRTLVELFAWLGDTLLYRANLIPERQRLAFLRLLGVQMRPAIPAQGIISLAIEDQNITQSVSLQSLATIKGAVNFETLSEVTVFPVSAIAYYKRRLTDTQKSQFANVVQGLAQIYQLTEAATPYFTTPIFAGGATEVAGFNLIDRTIDQSLWLALLAPKPELVAAIRQTLGTNFNGGQPLLNIGVMPAITIPERFEDIRPRAQIPFVWEISTGREVAGAQEYLALRVIADETAGLTRRGVMRLVLPATSDIGAPSNDVRTALEAGIGDRPPRIDVPEVAARLVTWLRLRPAKPNLTAMSLSWVGINAVEIDQRQTIFGRVIGQSDGSADQEFQLPGQSIELESLQIQVEELGRGYQPWQVIPDLALSNRDAAVFQLDSEAGTIRFGNGVRGRIPDNQQRIRVALMRAGGGRNSNLPPGALTDITAKDLQGNMISTKLKVLQSLPTDGGEDAETLAEAEIRIPDLFRHRDRAVTGDDYRRLVAVVPGAQIGRVEVLPRFKPQQRRDDVPGVVSVIVLPLKEAIEPPNPRPDRPLLETIYAYLDSRRPLGTELYVIGCEYVPLSLSIGVDIQDGFGQDSVLVEVREALRRFLWSLPPGGVAGNGWQLGKTVQDRELEVIVARVPGISSVRQINLFEKFQDNWRIIARNGCEPVALRLAPWQLPELLSVVIVVGNNPPTDLINRLTTSTKPGIGVPVVPEVC